MLSHGQVNTIGPRVYVVCAMRRHVTEGSLRRGVVKHAVLVAASGVHSNVKVSDIASVLMINGSGRAG